MVSKNLIFVLSLIIIPFVFANPYSTNLYTFIEAGNATSGGNVSSVTSSTNCIIVSPTVGDVVVTFNTSCAGGGSGGAVDSVEGDNIYLYTDPNTGNVIVYLNQTVLNQTIDARDNDTTYTFQTEDNNLTLDVTGTTITYGWNSTSVLLYLDNFYYPLTGNPSNFITLNEYFTNATQEFYPLTGNPSGFLTQEVDPYWSGNSSSVARIGDCPSGQVVQNTTTGGVECIADKDTTYTAGQDLTLTGTTFASNRTSLQDFFSTLFYPLSNPYGYLNTTTNIFDQSLNTTDNVSFNKAKLTSGILELITIPTRYLNIDVSSGVSLFNSSQSFQFYRDNSVKLVINNLATNIYNNLVMQNNNITSVDTIEALDTKGELHCYQYGSARTSIFSVISSSNVWLAMAGGWGGNSERGYIVPTSSDFTITDLTYYYEITTKVGNGASIAFKLYDDENLLITSNTLDTTVATNKTGTEAFSYGTYNVTGGSKLNVEINAVSTPTGTNETRITQMGVNVCLKSIA